MAIEAVQIGVNRNAPASSGAINLYSTGTAENLTLGQLMGSVCLRAGALYENQSVAKMNTMVSGTDNLEHLSDCMAKIAREEVNDWAAMKAELENTYGLLSLPGAIDSYDSRMEAMAVIKKSLERMTQTAQEDMIDLQTLINRRDVAYTTATNVVKSIQSSMGNMASQLARR